MTNTIVCPEQNGKIDSMRTWAFAWGLWQLWCRGEEGCLSQHWILGKAQRHLRVFNKRMYYDQKVVTEPQKQRKMCLDVSPTYDLALTVAALILDRVAKGEKYLHAAFQWSTIMHILLNSASWGESPVVCDNWTASMLQCAWRKSCSRFFIFEFYIWILNKAIQKRFCK